VNLPHPLATVVFKELPEGGILFSTATETYFSLNRVGVRIWHLLPPTCVTESDLVARLASEYPEVDAGIIASDVRQLLGDLLGNGLVEPPRSA
jgi:hypothetical protein